DGWIGWRDGDRADGRAGLVVEDRLPRRAAVDRLHHATRGGGDVDDVGIALHHGDVIDATAHDGRTDLAELQRLEWALGNRAGEAERWISARRRRRKGKSRLQACREKYHAVWCSSPMHSRIISINFSRSNGLRMELQTALAGIFSTPRFPAAVKTMMCGRV